MSQAGVKASLDIPTLLSLTHSAGNGHDARRIGRHNRCASFMDCQFGMFPDMPCREAVIQALAGKWNEFNKFLNEKLNLTHQLPFALVVPFSVVSLREQCRILVQDDQMNIKIPQIPTDGGKPYLVVSVCQHILQRHTRLSDFFADEKLADEAQISVAEALGIMRAIRPEFLRWRPIYAGRDAYAISLKDRSLTIAPVQQKTVLKKEICILTCAARFTLEEIAQSHRPGGGNT